MKTPRPDTTTPEDTGSLEAVVSQSPLYPFCVSCLPLWSPEHPNTLVSPPSYFLGPHTFTGRQWSDTMP